MQKAIRNKTGNPTNVDTLQRKIDARDRVEHKPKDPATIGREHESNKLAQAKQEQGQHFPHKEG
jgi:hypothetical protein